MLIAVSILCAVSLLWLATVMWKVKDPIQEDPIREEVVRRCFETGKMIIANEQPDGSIKIEEHDCPML